MSKKATDIVAYIGLIGWIIAYLAGDREASRFHLNQALVLAIAEIIVGVLERVLKSGILNVVLAILGVVLFVLWIIGIAAAIRGEDKKIPLLGDIELLK